MDNDKDKFLLSNIQKNNKKAFDALFRKYYPSLCQLAFLIVKSEEIAEEVVQEIFINIWEQRNRLKIKKSLRSYLFTATRNKALNYLSSEKKRLVYE
ncbi:MAG: sigma-70 family RNA polymerase sigma factor, partial [Bacteroidales bacterium]|nr:sigma-70 family RNA polymerase sigma factor [Bacteroidales bacterium]